jgi:ELWxxDGT repeat protein
MHFKPKRHSPLRPLSSVLLTLALGGCGLPEAPQPTESPATQAQALALPPGLAPSLVKDIQRGPDTNQSSFDSDSWSGVTQAAATSSAVYFTRSNRDLGTRDNELWRTDGTPAGTWPVRDFTLGRSHTFIDQIATVKEAVYLTAGGDEGNVLWKSDGTSEGTRPVSTSGGAVSGVSRLVPCGDQLYFVGYSPQGVNLWKSDGTPEGTLPMNTSAWLDWSIAPVCANGRMFFLAFEESYFGDHVLWTSDGTPEGTRRLSTIGSVFPTWNRTPNLVAVGSRVFLTTTGYQQALWTSDGTPEGTLPLGGSDPEAGMYMPLSLTLVGETLYFMAFDSSWNALLWKSDGTPEGTRAVVRLMDFWSSLAPLGDSLLLALNGELHRSDGTPEGTVLLEQLYLYNFEKFAAPLLGNRLFFSASKDFSENPSLWVSDGTVAGTHPLPAAQGPGPYRPASFTRLGDRLVFWADDGKHGLEPWVTDGTSAGTRMVRDLFRPDSSNPSSLVDMEGTLFFTAHDAEHGRELWKSDGTAEGTVLIKDLLPGRHGQGPQGLMPVGGLLFFFHDSGLWRTDGTEPGTRLLRNVSPLQNSLGSLGTTFFFSSWTPALGWELWKSDGTPEGTALFKDLNPGSWSSAPRHLTRVGDTLFFTAHDNLHGQELWKTDGTPEGTGLVKDVWPGRQESFIRQLVNVEGTLFFVAHDGVHGAQLWKSDGTAEGTRLVTELVSDPWSQDNFSGLVARGGTLFFVGHDDVHGRELWKSDGTAEGTVLVTDLSPGPGSAFLFPNNSDEPSPLNVIGESIYFAADDGVHGRELWKSDGTPEGTVLVGDLNPGPQGSGIVGTSLVPVGPHGGFAFSATEGVSGMELWTSDGTAEGTRRLLDVAKGTKGSSPLDLTVSGSRLFFVADDGVHGRELWSVKHTAFKSR